MAAGYDSGRAHSAGTSESWTEGESESEAYSSQRGRSSGVTDGVAESETEGTSSVVSDTESESTTHGTTHGTSIAKGKNWNRSKSTAHSQQKSTGITTGNSIGLGQSTSTGWSEAMVPILEKRPGGVHSKENVLYRAAQTLRSLPTGTCFINWVDRNGMQNALLRVPQLSAIAIPEEAFAKLRCAVFDASPSAIPTQEAQNRLADRRRRLLGAAHAQRLVKADVPEPATFRVAIGKRKGGQKGGV